MQNYFIIKINYLKQFKFFNKKINKAKEFMITLFLVNILELKFRRIFFSLWLFCVYETKKVQPIYTLWCG